MNGQIIHVWSLSKTTTTMPMCIPDCGCVVQILRYCCNDIMYTPNTHHVWYVGSCNNNFLILEIWNFPYLFLNVDYKNWNITFHLILDSALCKVSSFETNLVLLVLSDWNDFWARPGCSEHCWKNSLICGRAMHIIFLLGE